MDEPRAEAVIANMAGAAQPSFDGQGWLVVLNWFVMTAGFFLAVMLAGKLAWDLWACRHFDRWREPATVLRRIFLYLSLAAVLRFGAEAASLWGWNPNDPSATLAAAQAKRLLDPVSATLAWVAFGTFFLAYRSLVEQLRKRPLPLRMWATIPQLKKPAIVVVLCLLASIGVVTTR